MNKMVPYEKLSKRKKRELDQKQRRDWGALSPVTRRSDNPKAYKRKQGVKWREDPLTPCLFFIAIPRWGRLLQRAQIFADLLQSGLHLPTVQMAVAQAEGLWQLKAAAVGD